MKTLVLKNGKALLTWIMLMLCVNVWCLSDVYSLNTEEGENVDVDGDWEGKSEYRSIATVSITKHSQFLTIQEGNPVNTITARITCNETGAVVFENVYPKEQTSLIVIPMNGWSAGSYTIELFGKENNGYLWGIFQVLP